MSFHNYYMERLEIFTKILFAAELAHLQIIISHNNLEHGCNLDETGLNYR